jgi:hypothetical protein
MLTHYFYKRYPKEPEFQNYEYLDLLDGWISEGGVQPDLFLVLKLLNKSALRFVVR